MFPVCFVGVTINGFYDFSLYVQQKVQVHDIYVNKNVYFELIDFLSTNEKLYVI